MRSTTPPKTESTTVAIDRENAFLLYATFCGDAVRTAAAINVPVRVVLAVAQEENWTRQLAPILELKKSNHPGDVERAVNRALNFVQAHKMRLFLQRVIARVTGMTSEELEEYLMTQDSKDGTRSVKKLSTRALADLASAMEKVQTLTYAALSDGVQERMRRKEEDSTGSASEMHLQISKAFAEVRASDTPRAALFDAQLSIAQEREAETKVFTGQ
jgi:hypothetical protein